MKKTFTFCPTYVFVKQYLSTHQILISEKNKRWLNSLSLISNTFIFKGIIWRIFYSLFTTYPQNKYFSLVFERKSFQLIIKTFYSYFLSLFFGQTISFYTKKLSQSAKKSSTIDRKAYKRQYSNEKFISKLFIESITYWNISYMYVLY